MCLSPKYITNRTLHWNLFQPLKLKVPCGKCEECKRVNRNEWFVRSYFEWTNSRKSTFFYTLTYNNDYLPKFDGIACFRKKDLQDFLKRLRFRLAKYNLKLKYLITCEYGKLKNRSHYHALFFLDREINPYWFLRFVTDSWICGFVRPGDNCGLVSSDLGIQYVTKYITKDCLHTDALLPLLAPRVFLRYYTLFNYVCRRYNHFPLCSFRMNNDFSFSRVLLGRCSDDDLEFTQKFLTKIRRQVNRYVPFHLQSSRLGVSMIDSVNDVLEQVPVLRSNGKIKPYHIPRYIKRLLWYDCVEGEHSHKKDTFVLNENGKKHLFDKISLQVESDVVNFQNTLLNASSIDSSIICSLNKLGFGFKHPRDIVFWCQHFDLDLNVLSIYKNVFRGRCDFIGYDDLTPQYIIDSWKDVLDYHINQVPNMDFAAIYKDSKLVANLTSILWNNNPLFQPYEQALIILEEISFHLSNRQIFASLESDKNSRKLRDYLNNL